MTTDENDISLLQASSPDISPGISPDGFGFNENIALKILAPEPTFHPDERMHLLLSDLRVPRPPGMEPAALVGIYQKLLP